MPSGSSFSAASLRSTPTTVNRAAASFLRRLPAPLAARADHDRHPLAHVPVTFGHGWSGPLGPKSRRVECRIMNVVLWTNALTSAAASTPVYLAMIGSAARSVIVSR
jgi:hypothetical protein